jgi:RNA polymerase sigma-70 factor (ECF subfamily)
MKEKSDNIIFSESMFEQVFKMHFQHLFNFALQFIPDEDVAKDITQSVFIKLWEHRENVDVQKSVKSYLFTSVRNTCINHIRDNKKFNSRILDVELAEMDFSELIDTVAYSELENKVNAVLVTLPEKSRQIFELSRFENKKYREIAEELGISEKTVEAHMSKVLKILKEELKDYLFLFIVYLLSKF